MAKEPKIVPFGKYELLEKIAVGGMAEIFKARTKGVGGFEKYLAIKRILPHLSENKDFIDMLINEAKIAVMLSHANIVQIYDLGKIDDSYFIAMEYIEGKDLRALMTRCDQIGMPLFIQHAIFIAIEACKGLEYAHSKTDGGPNPRELNIVHRDISPQNVMISYEGEVKITDFGIAKANVNISETEAGVVKGKYEYMSPEQASGLVVDRRTDIFSTGIVLYEMLTGQKPFRGESDLTILERVREAKVDPPSKYNKSIPKKLEKIVLKALSKDAPDRYQTSTELKDELTRFFYSSTFNFTTSNLAAFMKSIFAEEIKLDVLSDADGTGINKKPMDVGDGNTLSRIFGKPTSDKFRKNGANVAVGGVTTDSSQMEPSSSSRTLGGEALASIEDEINRILIPGKTNFGKLPSISNNSSPTQASNSGPALSAGADPISGTSPIPRDETGQRATVATPRPTTPSGNLLGDMQSAAMELAMEIDMAMPPVASPSRIGPAPRPAAPQEAEVSASSEAATEAGRALSWDGAEEKISDLGEDRAPATSPGRESSPPRSFNVEVDESPERPASNGHESTIITPNKPDMTGSRSTSRPLSSAPSSPPPMSASISSRPKVPMKAVKERIRGVTVNAAVALPAEEPRSREVSSNDHIETIAGASADRIEVGARGESTVIGRKPAVIEGTEPAGRRPPSISRVLSSVPDEPRREISRSQPLAQPSRVASIARNNDDFQEKDEPEFEPPSPRRSRAAPTAAGADMPTADDDDQADLYPAEAKRVTLHPAVAMLLAAIVFFAGVVLAKVF